MSKSQLYTTLNEISAPVFGYLGPSAQRELSHIISDLPFVRWPNGKPCIAVNAYILDVQRNGVAGGTLQGYASNLSHVIRYCACYEIGFHELTDNDIWNLSEQLQKEKKKNDPAALERGANTVRTILSKTLRFLAWYQKTFLMHTDMVLIGELSEAPCITVRIRVNENYYAASNRKIKMEITVPELDTSGSHYLHHPSFPVAVSVDPKQPITLPQIQAIEKTIDAKALVAIKGVSGQPKNSTTFKLVAAKAEYMRARRMFTVWLMKRTGLRPKELLGTPLDQDVIKNKSIEIPTMKRGMDTPPIRKFPVGLKDALRFIKYTASRAAFVRVLKEHNPAYVDPAQILLAESGKAVKKPSIAKDFKRLANESGFEDANACLKMFRIRFITQQVAAHLKEKIQQTGRDQRTFEDADYTAILKRIAELTGHKDEKSLWCYVAKGWEELGLWIDVDRNIGRLNAADVFFDELLDLRHELQTSPPEASTQIVDYCIKRLSQIIGDNKELLGDAPGEEYG